MSTPRQGPPPTEPYYEPEPEARQQKPAAVRETPNYEELNAIFPQWSKAELQIVWERNDEIKTLSDLRFFLYYCKQNRLDPVIGEGIATYRWNSIKRALVLTPIVSINVLRKRRAEDCDGIDQFVYAYKDEQLFSASGTIYRKGASRPFSATIFYGEYAGTDRTGNITSIWRLKGHIMTSKCLEAVLTRLAFFDLCGELLIDEETQTRERDEAAEAVPEFKVGKLETAKPPVEATVIETSQPPAETIQPKTETPASPVPPEPPKTETPPDTVLAMIEALKAKIGGKPNTAQTLIGNVYRGYCGLTGALKKEQLTIEPLLALWRKLEQNPRALEEQGATELGRQLAGKTEADVLTAYFDKLNWNLQVREQAQAVIRARAYKTAEAFIMYANACGLPGMDGLDVYAFLTVAEVTKEAWKLTEIASQRGIPIRQVATEMLEYVDRDRLTALPEAEAEAMVSEALAKVAAKGKI